MRDRLPEALRVYVTAMRYPVGVEFDRGPEWARHILNPGWAGVGAFALRRGTPPPAPGNGWLDAPPPGSTLIGVGYAYTGRRGQWWHDQVRRGLHASTDAVGRRRDDSVLDDYAELAELHVRPEAQGHGIGERLLVRLMTGRGEGAMLLSTPEVAGGTNRAWRLYRRHGFTDVLRGFRFDGDERPFAVLGTELPAVRPGASPRGDAERT